MSSSTSFLGISADFESYQIGFIIVGTIYLGFFLMISNHYVFKPKVEELFAHSMLKSRVMNQTLIDFVANLPHIIFIATSVLVSKNDTVLQVLIYTDTTWLSLYIGILAFKSMDTRQSGDWKLMLIKSILFLGLAYLTISTHYIAQSTLISLGAILFILYYVNLLLEAYEEKFVSTMSYFFAYKPQKQTGNSLQLANKMYTPQYLAKNFPVLPTELKQKMKVYSNDLQSINLKTKALIAQKLMRIAIAVHLSKGKLERKAKRDIKYYYGTFNGTVIEKSRRMIVEKPTSYQQQLEEEEEEHASDHNQFQQADYCIFYLFPVKILESNKYLSVIFSLIINICFGFLLSFTLFLAGNYQHGIYIQLIYSFFLLPIIPKTTKADFCQSMTMSSLWKYSLYGIFIISSCLSNQSLNFDLSLSSALRYSPVIQLLISIIVIYYITSSELVRYKYIFVWFAAIALYTILEFKTNQS